ncbi:MAG: ribosome maturation factor RimM [Alphaproteobacteria bacterium]|nr:ribosome maturation factor RimM [Alphaproteobacteria bacterium]
MKLILVGQFIAAHGIKGEVKVKSFTEDPLGLCDYKVVQDESGSNKYHLKIIGEHQGAHKNTLIAKVKGIADRNAAEALVRTKPKLYVTRDQLPELKDGRYYVEDLKGFSAVSDKGKVIATLTDIHNFGAGDILVLQPLEGKEFMLPFKEPYAGDLNIKKRSIRIMIPHGWLADEKPPKSEKEAVEKPTKKKAK